MTTIYTFETVQDEEEEEDISDAETVMSDEVKNVSAKECFNLFLKGDEYFEEFREMVLNVVHNPVEEEKFIDMCLNADIIMMNVHKYSHEQVTEYFAFLSLLFQFSCFLLGNSTKSYSKINLSWCHSSSSNPKMIFSYSSWRDFMPVRNL